MANDRITHIDVAAFESDMRSALEMGPSVGTLKHVLDIFINSLTTTPYGCVERSILCTAAETIERIMEQIETQEAAKLPSSPDPDLQNEQADALVDPLEISELLNPEAVGVGSQPRSAFLVELKTMVFGVGA